MTGTLSTIAAKYKNILENKLEGTDRVESTKEFDQKQTTQTREYKQFKKEALPKHFGIYEQLCNWAEKNLKIKPSPAKAKSIQEAIDALHINITPIGVQSFSILVPLALTVIGGAFSYLFLDSLFFVVFFLFLGLAMMGPLGNIPQFMANSWRMKASNQMVLSIFYVVTYMRHTSNIELAMEFASDHLTPPLSLDFKRVLWNVETAKYSTVRESLDAYLQTWKKYNSEFVESFHLIESSLFEADEGRRLTLLDKSLDVILDGTYEKMLHYAQSLKSPITMLHMMGIILPILGLVILPLVVSFMQGVSWLHLSALYNVALPIAIFYLGKKILSTRPTGYGDTDVGKENPAIAALANQRNFMGIPFKASPSSIAIIVFIFLFLIGLSPIILGSLQTAEQLKAETPIIGSFYLLGYRESTDDPDAVNGPFGDGASVLSLALTLSFGLSLGIYYRLKSSNVKKVRDEAKKLETEFGSALFQLGNRLGDGMPTEMAFSRVAETMQDTVSGRFFQRVDQNIRKLGMSVENAIFDPKHGALNDFPSAMIESSMKVLTESVKKGPQVAAQALVNISRYIKEIHKVDERLKDLMADIISSMKSQVKFMTPAISGIVIGITAMITNIIGKLSQSMKDVAQGQSSLPGMFGDGLPTYYFQLVVGLYVVQLCFILTILTNGIENGSDKLNEKFMLGQVLVRSTVLYCVLSLVVMILFTFIANQIIQVTVPGA